MTRSWRSYIIRELRQPELSASPITSLQSTTYITLHPQVSITLFLCDSAEPISRAFRLCYTLLSSPRPGRQIPSEMANESERSTAADKGKGKVEDVRELNGKKPQKDEKTTADGKKKDEEPQEGMSPNIAQWIPE